MKRSAYAFFGVVLCLPVFAQQHGSHGQPASPAATLMSGYGDLHHPVTTSNTEAQTVFRSGIAADLCLQS